MFETSVIQERVAQRRYGLFSISLAVHSLVVIAVIAAQSGVLDDQMKWLGRIRHHDLVKFVRKHQLDWNWVLLGVPEKAPQRPALRVIQGGLR